MTYDAITILQLLFVSIWRLFTSWYIPGTHTTPGAFILYLGFVGIILRFIGRVTMTYNPHADKPLDEGYQLHYHLPPGRG